MEGSYCGTTGTSTRGTLSLRQTGGNRLKIAGVRACRHVFPGQRHKGMSEPRRAGHLPFPSLQGQARPWGHRAAQPARFRPQQRPLTPITPFLVTGSVPPGGAAASSPSASRQQRGPGRARTITAQRTISTPLYLSAEVTGGMSSSAAAGGAAAGKRSLGVTPPPRRDPGPRSLPRPHGAARCARPAGLRQRVRGWPGRLPCAPHCLRADSGAAAACSVAACLQGCYYLSGCYLHGCHLLLARLL